MLYNSHSEVFSGRCAQRYSYGKGVEAFMVENGVRHYCSSVDLLNERCALERSRTTERAILLKTF
jgi:hypothetical protein